VLQFKSKHEKEDDLVESIFATAWQAYIAMGRGAFIHEFNSLTAFYQLRYIELGNAETEFEHFLEEDFSELVRLIEDYNPEIEFIVVYATDDNIQVKTHRAGNRRTPREAWEWEQKQRESLEF
jgi:hypothetical protein